jgi:hypothetical protein
LWYKWHSLNATLEQQTGSMAWILAECVVALAVGCAPALKILLTKYILTPISTATRNTRTDKSRSYGSRGTGNHTGHSHTGNSVRVEGGARPSRPSYATDYDELMRNSAETYPLPDVQSSTSSASTRIGTEAAGKADAEKGEAGPSYDQK